MPKYRKKPEIVGDILPALCKAEKQKLLDLMAQAIRDSIGREIVRQWVDLNKVIIVNA